MHYKFKFQKKKIQILLFKDIKQCIIKNKRKIVIRFKDLKIIYNRFIFTYVIDIFE
jgi:hypothetical protein